MEIDRRELAKVPYLDVSEAGERYVPLQPYYDGREWHLWALHDGSTLVRLQVPDFIQGRYFAAEPARPSDCVFRLLDFTTKRAYFPEVEPIAAALEHDLLNLSAALWKVELQSALPTSGPIDGSRLVVTDIEFILVTCRSYIDLVQFLLSKLWNRVKLNPTSGFRHRVELPSASMADVIAIGEDSLRPVDEIRRKWSLPDHMVAFYERNAPFVLRMRGARDAIVHEPTLTPIVFKTRRGFAVRVDAAPFRDLVTWSEDHLEPNRLGSLRFFLADVVRRTLLIGEEMVVALAKTVSLPSDVAPGLDVFLRSDCLGVLSRLDVVADQPWEPLATVDLLSICGVSDQTDSAALSTAQSTIAGASEEGTSGRA